MHKCIVDVIKIVRIWINTTITVRVGVVQRMLESTYKSQNRKNWIAQNSDVRGRILGDSYRFQNSILENLRDVNKKITSKKKSNNQTNYTNHSQKWST